RTQAWERLADLLPESFYENASTEVALEKAAETAAALIDNKVTGRTLVKVR
ncbi:MAG: oxidoreductase, partial [Enterobacterales bacterium]|nr:oxidoreductase [Enterobacterales bacterium]